MGFWSAVRHHPHPPWIAKGQGIPTEPWDARQGRGGTELKGRPGEHTIAQCFKSMGLSESTRAKASRDSRQRFRKWPTKLSAERSTYPARLATAQTVPPFYLSSFSFFLFIFFFSITCPPRYEAYISLTPYSRKLLTLAGQRDWPPLPLLPVRTNYVRRGSIGWLSACQSTR